MNNKILVLVALVALIISAVGFFFVDRSWELGFLAAGLAVYVGSDLV